MLSLVHQLVQYKAASRPDNDALRLKDETLTYQQLWQRIQAAASGLEQLGLNRGDRVATYLPKTFESVITLFAASTAGCVFVPINPLLKPAQVQHILQDCNVACLVTSADRATQLAEVLSNTTPDPSIIIADSKNPQKTSPSTYLWCDLCSTIENPFDPFDRQMSITDEDVAAILYTSGSTGKPKGVVLSHHNLLSGAESVASYLKNTADDRLLAVLPFSFDYGLSQLTTAFFSGASVVLMDYLLPRDVIRAVERYGITGLAAVPPLWNQLADLEWPSAAHSGLRYITNSGGAVTPALSDKLHHALPHTAIYLMYGLTEAFRSTYLPPEQLAVRPTSIGKAIPNAEVVVVRPDGSLCDDNEAGELVHRGPLVALGYWNAPEKTAERFKPFPCPKHSQLPFKDIAVWSGDKVYRDSDGYLYFVSREDEMIKTSGYRVSPAEVEEVLLNADWIGEAVALGIPHPTLGQAILAVISTSASDGFENKSALQDTQGKHDELEVNVKRHCQQSLPNYMIPSSIIVLDALPKNPNGKIDRAGLHRNYQDLFTQRTP